MERRSLGRSLSGDSDFQHRRPKFWSEGAGRRLMEVRREWDPDGRICDYLDVDDNLKTEFERKFDTDAQKWKVDG